MTSTTFSRPVAGSSLSDWLDYLLAIHPTEIDMGLSRVSQVALRLGVKSLDDTLVITVGGTNGKGSTCTMLESVLRLAGYSVGVYTSPHLLKYNERIRIDGIDAPDVDIIAAFEAIDSARGELSLTFFEFATLAGLLLFKAAKLDAVILEVGLGGRLDATNLIDADISVITAVDLDHQAFLGNTRESVGREKAGIFRKDRPAIVGEAQMPNTVAEVASAVGAKLYRVGEQFSYCRHSNGWDYQGKTKSFINMPLPQLPLPNAATVIAVIEAIGPRLIISDEAVVQGISNARLSGRLEQVNQSPLVIVDVAHNPHAARYLRDELQGRWQGKRVLALCGMLKDKDYAEVLRIMHPVVEQWFLISLDGERGASADMLADAMPQGAKYQRFSTINDAKDTILAVADESNVVIVFGSFYTVSGFKSLI